MAKKTIFRAILSLLILFFSFLTWYSIYLSLWQNGSDYLKRIFLPLIFFLILGVLVGLWFLAENRRLIWWVAPMLLFLPFLVVFSFSLIRVPSPWQVIILIFLGLVIAFFALGIFSLKREKDSRMKIILRSILYPALHPTLTAMVLLISLAFYFSPLAQLDMKEISIPRPIFDSLFNPLLQTIEKNILKSSFNNGLRNQNHNLPSQIVGQTETSKNSLSDQTYAFLNQVIVNAGRPFKKYLPLGLTLSFFFALKIFERVFLWLEILGVWILWKILRFLNILKIKITKVDKEMIEV